MSEKNVKSTGIHRMRTVRRGNTEPDWAAVKLVVDRVRLVKLYPNELCMAIWILKRRGVKHMEIARHLGCNSRTVTRHIHQCKPDKCETYQSRRRRHDQPL